jgi:multisubunit Na+/H+ antiporter MnhB subunit
MPKRLMRTTKSPWPKYTGWWVAVAIAIFGTAVSLSVTREPAGAIVAAILFIASFMIIAILLFKKRIQGAREERIRIAQFLGAVGVTLLFLTLPGWFFLPRVGTSQRAKLHILHRQASIAEDQSIRVNIYVSSEGPLDAVGLQHFDRMKFVTTPFGAAQKASVSKSKQVEDELFGDLRREMSGVKSYPPSVSRLVIVLTPATSPSGS